MAEIEGTTDDFQQMLSKLKQRVNDIATVKANVTAQEPGTSDLKDSISRFTETIKSGFAVMLDAKAADLERLGTMATEAAAVKKGGDAASAELKKEITSTLNTMLSEFNTRIEGSLKDTIRSSTMSVRDDVASVKSIVSTIDINTIGNKLNTMGGTIDTLSTTVKDLKNTAEQLKASGSGDISSTLKGVTQDAMRGLIQEIKLSVGEAIGTRLDAALAPLKGEIAALRGELSALKREPATSSGVSMDSVKTYVDGIRREFNGELREIMALIDRETSTSQTQTLEFLKFVTDKIINLHNKVDSISRPGGAMTAPVTRTQSDTPTPPASPMDSGTDNAIQREIAPIMDGLVHIIRFLIALSKR